VSAIDFKTNFILNFYPVKIKSSKFCVEKYSQNLVRQNLKRSKNGLKNRTKIFEVGKKANKNGKKAEFLWILEQKRELTPCLRNCEIPLATSEFLTLSVRNKKAP